MNQTVWSPKFTAGNRRFLTKRLWGAANEPPYFHHGLFTTMRQAVLAHSGEALERDARSSAAEVRSGLPDRVPQDAAGAARRGRRIRSSTSAISPRRGGCRRAGRRRRRRSSVGPLVSG